MFIKSSTVHRFLLALSVFILSGAIATAAQADSFAVNVSLSQTGSLSGLKVYAFTEAGSYTGLNTTTDASGVAVFDESYFVEGTYQFRVDYLSGQYWSTVVSIPQDSAVSVLIEEGNLEVTVQNQTELLEGVKVYLFTDAGAYLGKNATTGADGIVNFVIPTGMNVKLRADNLGYQFWSDTATVASFTAVDLLISYQNVTATVSEVFNAESTALEGVKVYLFTAAGSYLGLNKTTDLNGQVVFYLPERAYKVRADYLSQQYWSSEFTATDSIIDIPHSEAQVTVTGSGLPISGAAVYVYTQSGSYLGISGTTDSNGQIVFRLPSGNYKFRSDYQSSQYWSVEQTLMADQVHPVEISTGGGAFNLTVTDNSGQPLENANCYLFNDQGAYLGITAATDGGGKAVFNLADGSYQFRIDYMGYQFWTISYEVPNVLYDTHIIDHDYYTVTVTGDFQGSSDPIEGVKVYLFKPSEEYMGLNQITDAKGQVTFYLPTETYYARADYLDQQYWSESFSSPNTNIGIPMGDADVLVSLHAGALPNVSVYVFSESGSYLGITGTTDANGESVFRLPAGIYNFRADYLNNQYWSGQHELIADTVNLVDIYTGGGAFNLTVLKDHENALLNEKTYLFNSTGSYLGISNTTDEHGQVSYSLPDGSYQFRVDTKGYQFWSTVYDVPTILSDVFTIAHQDVTVTVQGIDPEPTPLEGLDVYLFKPSGVYLGLQKATDIDGKVAFNLPEEQYQVRVDYLSQQFWSDVFQWQDTTVPIYRGVAELHVHLAGTDIIGANVYLFSEGGSYLGWYETTDETGKVSFLLPDRPYKFRIDYDGNQYWSDEITVTSGTSNPIDIDLTPPTVTINAEPSVIQTGQSALLSWTPTNAYECVLEPEIGEVAVSGSLSVFPASSTIYTVTATGPGGSVSASVEVLVDTGLPDDLDFGLAFDEQQGGAGLIGESVRILNGNAVETRTDLRFPSPNSLGLAFSATYNSRSAKISAMGHGWSHTYALTLDPAYTILGASYIKIIDETGRAVYFSEDTPGTYTGAFNEKSTLVVQGGEYIWQRLDGSKFGFSSQGRLLWMEDEKTNRINLSYDVQNRLETAIDSATGRSITFNYNAENQIVSISGPVTATVGDGIWVTFGYDSADNLTSVTYADGSGFDYFYTDASDVHNLTEKRDRASHLLASWSYDDQDRVVSTFRLNGQNVTLGYIGELQREVTDAYNVVRTYTLGDFEGRKRLVAMQGPALPPYSSDNVLQWTYDSQLNLTEVQLGGGTINQFLNFDERGNPGTVILAAGTADARTLDFTYHPEINVIQSRSETSVLGSGDKQTIWDFDNDYDEIPNETPTPLISKIIEKGFTHDASGTVVPYEYVTQITYNSKGQVISIDGPKSGSGDTTAFTYNSTTGDLLSINQPIIGSTVFSDYNAAGQFGMVTDVNSQTERFLYDGRGRIVEIIHDADGSSSQISYNAAGLVETTVDEDGVSRGFIYDSAYGRLVQKTDMDSNYIAYSYDSQGNLVEKGIHEASGTRTSFNRWSYQHPTYPGMLWKEINADNTYSEYLYDAAGNIVSFTDPETHTTGYAYDPINRLKAVTQPGDIVTSYNYNAHGGLISVTDANNNSTTFIYDDMGRVVTRNSPDTGTTAYAYDEAGNLIQKTDAKTITIQYVYDDLNRLTHVNFPDSTQNIAFSYDIGTYGKGRRTGITDPSGSTSFEYDARGRLVGKISTVNNVSYSLDRSFTAGGRLTSLTYPSGRTVDYTRYPNGRTQQISTTYGANTVNLVSNLVYQPFGRPKSLSSASGGIVDTQSGDCGCLEVANPGTPWEMVYTYDGNRNVKTIQGTNKPWLNQDYTYDPLNRLTAATGAYGSYSFSYDDVGNRLTRIANGKSSSYDYISGTNQLSTIAADGESVNYSYDLNGNISAVDGRTFVYNQDNRLVRVEDDVNIIGEYTYNGLGQRIVKTVGAETTVFHYGFDDKIIAESSSEGTFRREYLYMGNGPAALIDVGSGNIYYYLNDHLGTPQFLTDSTNTIIWEATYKPFGEALANSKSEVEQNLRFPGQYYDQETGLHYNWHRYYDPKTGRYLTPDPIGLRGGINPFVYVLNNPVNAIDPLGLMSATSAAAIDAIINNPNIPHEQKIEIIKSIPTNLPDPKANITNIFRPTNFNSNKGHNTDFTSGQVWAAGKVVLGSGLIIAGTVTLPEGVYLIGAGIPILADGAASSFVEFALDGDTSNVPPTMNHAVYLIVEGALEADYGSNNKCEDK